MRTSTYSADEDQIILDLVKQLGPTQGISVAAERLNRTPKAVYNRYYTFLRKEKNSQQSPLQECLAKARAWSNLQKVKLGTEEVNLTYILEKVRKRQDLMPLTEYLQKVNVFLIYNFYVDWDNMPIPFVPNGFKDGHTFGMYVIDKYQEYFGRTKMAGPAGFDGQSIEVLRKRLSDLEVNPLSQEIDFEELALKLKNCTTSPEPQQRKFRKGLTERMEELKQLISISSEDEIKKAKKILNDELYVREERRRHEEEVLQKKMQLQRQIEALQKEMDSLK